MDRLLEFQKELKNLYPGARVFFKEIDSSFHGYKIVCIRYIWNIEVDMNQKKKKKWVKLPSIDGISDHVEAHWGTCIGESDFVEVT